MISDFRALGAQVSNRGRWGGSDQRGTLNHVTPASIRRAAELVQLGEMVDLSIPLDEDGPQDGRLRSNPRHVVLETAARLGSGYGALRYADDAVSLPLQSGTHVDSLAHVHYDGELYNGVPFEGVFSERGASCLGADAMMPGVATRGILLDFPRHFGVERLERGQAIEARDLDAALAAAGLETEPGDALIIRTGWIDRFVEQGQRGHLFGRQPGLGMSCIMWLHERRVSMVAADNIAIEVVPSQVPGESLPFHMVAIRDMGLHLTELCFLKQLAGRCAQEERWDFMFCAFPLNIRGGIGAPVTPVAIL